MIERMRNGNGHRHGCGNRAMSNCGLDSEVAGKEKIIIVAVLRPPLFCWIYYA